MPLNSDTYARASVVLLTLLTEAEIPGGIVVNMLGFLLFLCAIGYFLFTGPLFGKNNKKISGHE